MVVYKESKTMNKFLTVVMYIFWIASLIGILVITFTGFQYMDLNMMVGILLLFTILNTFFTVYQK